jgi:hypothetical protein
MYIAIHLHLNVWCFRKVATLSLHTYERNQDVLGGSKQTNQDESEHINAILKSLQDIKASYQSLMALNYISDLCKTSKHHIKV